MSLVLSHVSKRLRSFNALSNYQITQFKSVESLDIPEFMNISSQILDKIGVEGLYHGNVDKNDANHAQQEILSLLKASGGGGGLARKKYPRQYVLLVPMKNQVLRCGAKDPTDPNRGMATTEKDAF